MKRLALVLVATWALSSSARAQDYDYEEESSTYVAFRIGSIMPKTDDLTGFDNGLAVEGAVGFKADRNFAFELGVGRFAMGAEASGYVDIGGYIYPATVTADVVAYSVTGTAKLIAPLQQVQLYGLLGGGVYFMTNEVSLDVEGYGSESVVEDEANPFAFFIGGGLDVRVTPRTSLGAELKYIIGEADIWGDGNEYEFNSAQFCASLRYSL